jgi:hypothetical protein
VNSIGVSGAKTQLQDVKANRAMIVEKGMALTKTFGKKNLDVLQNIEFRIVEVYRADPSLLDIDAKDAIDAPVRHYHAEVEERTPPVRNLGPRAQGLWVGAANVRVSPWPGHPRRRGLSARSGQLSDDSSTVYQLVPRRPPPIRWWLMSYHFRHSVCNGVFENWDFGETCKAITKAGYEGIEIAPFTFSETPATIPAERRAQCRNIMASEGLEFVGLHWLMVAPKGLHLTTSDPQTTGTELAASARRNSVRPPAVCRVGRRRNTIATAWRKWRHMRNSAK